MKGFDCESITFKAALNIFERMEIAESIYEGVVEPYYKKPTGEDSNCDYYSRKIRREAASPTTYSSTSERS